VEKYNKLNPEYSIDYTYGKAVSSVDSVFEIRELLRLAIQRVRTENAATAPEKASGVSKA
jgi:hypothetical protein